jgi:hypothetical protein
MRHWVAKGAFIRGVTGPRGQFSFAPELPCEKRSDHGSLADNYRNNILTTRPNSCSLTLFQLQASLVQAVDRINVGRYIPRVQSTRAG